MIDFLGVPISLLNVTGWGAFVLLVAAGLRWFVRGDVRTDREYQELVKDRDKWQAAWEERGETLRHLLAQNSKLLEVGETSARVLTSLPTPAEEAKTDG